MPENQLTIVLKLTGRIIFVSNRLLFTVTAFPRFDVTREPLDYNQRLPAILARIDAILHSGI